MSLLGPIVKIVVGIALIVVAIVLGPLLSIWAINTLFPATNIPYTLETWAAALLLASTIHGSTIFGKSNK